MTLYPVSTVKETSLRRPVRILPTFHPYPSGCCLLRSSLGETNETDSNEVQFICGESGGAMNHCRTGVIMRRDEVPVTRTILSTIMMTRPRPYDTWFWASLSRHQSFDPRPNMHEWTNMFPRWLHRPKFVSCKSLRASGHMWN